MLSVFISIEQHHQLESIYLEIADEDTAQLIAYATICTDDYFENINNSTYFLMAVHRLFDLSNANYSHDESAKEYFREVDISVLLYDVTHITDTFIYFLKKLCGIDITLSPQDINNTTH